MLQLLGRIKIASGDITLLAVDAIVNAANKSLLGAVVLMVLFIKR